jgi:hypothetical protein
LKIESERNHDRHCARPVTEVGSPSSLLVV